MKFDCLVNFITRTSGDGYWSNQIKTVKIHRVALAYVSADIDNFKKVERTVSLASGTGRKYNFAVGFLENHQYLNSFYNTGATGAVWFYNCFVVFS